MDNSLQKWVDENEGKSFNEMSPFPQGWAFLEYSNGLVITSKKAIKQAVKAMIAEEKARIEKY